MWIKVMLNNNIGSPLPCSSGSWSASTKKVIMDPCKYFQAAKIAEFISLPKK